MQTFLPFADFARSAASLDMKRLGKQRVENLQLIQALSGWKLTTKLAMHDPNRGPRVFDLPRSAWTIRRDPVGWTNHPCKKMWFGYEGLFRDYHRAICAEWLQRGYKDTCLVKFDVVWDQAYEEDPDEGTPAWLGDSLFHLSYQALLVRKMPDYYADQFPGAPENMEFKFPV